MTSFDGDHDGYYETSATDADGDGYAETASADEDRDGYDEFALSDHDRNGAVERSSSTPMPTAGGTPPSPTARPTARPGRSPWPIPTTTATRTSSSRASDTGAPQFPGDDHERRQAPVAPGRPEWRAPGWPRCRAAVRVAALRHPSFRRPSGIRPLAVPVRAGSLRAPAAHGAVREPVPRHRAVPRAVPRPHTRRVSAMGVAACPQP